MGLRSDDDRAVGTVGASHRRSVRQPQSALCGQSPRSARASGSASSRTPRRPSGHTTVDCSCRPTSRTCGRSRAWRRAAWSRPRFPSGMISSKLAWCSDSRSGVIAKLSAYHKRSSPGIDDNTVPGSVDHHVGEHRPGADQGPRDGARDPAQRPTLGVPELRPQPRLRHRPDHGRILPGRQPRGYFDLDHDQRISAGDGELRRPAAVPQRQPASTGAA